ncbi:hypothetical protein NHF48_003215 [Sphingomonas sp. H160509]|uniref:hypothetical protein n=1 Tax=Sphingomonas sp. H160509 TaxID=2955313 RepID=UPI0020979C57|nr:hypothetical protein [Sphingomonas sp. H160509]MDD1450204.1 hypothetical protein [Sphingomonas sp. H160509]
MIGTTSAFASIRAITSIPSKSPDAGVQGGVDQKLECALQVASSRSAGSPATGSERQREVAVRLGPELRIGGGELLRELDGAIEGTVALEAEGNDLTRLVVAAWQFQGGQQQQRGGGRIALQPEPLCRIEVESRHGTVLTFLLEEHGKSLGGGRHCRAQRYRGA